MSPPGSMTSVAAHQPAEIPPGGLHHGQKVAVRADISGLLHIDDRQRAGECRNALGCVVPGGVVAYHHLHAAAGKLGRQLGNGAHDAVEQIREEGAALVAGHADRQRRALVARAHRG